MAVTLTVERDRWRAHLDRAAAARPGLVPVVKGNGYGLGRTALLAECDRLGLDVVAVGTAWELADVPPGRPAVVLTPCGPAEAAALTPGAVPTVGTRRDVDVLRAAGRAGGAPVVVKLATSMRRYGATPAELPDLLAAVAEAGATVHAFGAHFPLDTTSADHAAEVAAWLPLLPPDATVHVSHVDPADLAALAAAPVTGGRRLRPRVGTALWLGDRGALHLGADVVAVRPVAAGERAGYRQVPTPGEGHLVLVSAGTAHGVRALDDGRSPFHFARTRLALLEPPHMHTSMLHVPAGEPCPAPGDVVDVQRPLTQVQPDRLALR